MTRDKNPYILFQQMVCYFVVLVQLKNINFFPDVLQFEAKMQVVCISIDLKLDETEHRPIWYASVKQLCYSGMLQINFVKYIKVRNQTSLNH